MTGPVLAFRLTGPMAAFGDPATDERRGTEPRPTRSGALGLVAAALGIAREDRAMHLSLSESLGFATRIFPDRGALRDWHTIQTPKGKTIRAATRAQELSEFELNTKLSQRWYMQSVDADIFLWQEKDSSPQLTALASALRRPRYALYLGRKSCPLGAPLEPVVFEDLAAALARKPLAPPIRREGVVPALYSDPISIPPLGYRAMDRSSRIDSFQRAGGSWGHAPRVEIRYEAAP